MPTNKSRQNFFGQDTKAIFTRKIRLDLIKTFLFLKNTVKRRENEQTQTGKNVLNSYG